MKPTKIGLGLILVPLDLAIWIITFGPLKMVASLLSKKSIRAKSVGTATVSDGSTSPVFRSVVSVEQGSLTKTPFKGSGTLYDLCERSYKTYGKSNALGVRPFLSWRDHSQEMNLKPNERKFPSKVFGPTQWLTYAETGKRAHEFGAGLRSLGMTPIKDDKNFEDQHGPFAMLIFEDTCAEWQIAAQGAFSQSMVVSTAYATLGVEAVITAVNEGGVATILCNRLNVQKLVGKAASMPSLKNIIYTNLWISQEEAAKRVEVPDHHGLTILSFEEVVERGQNNPVPAVPPRPDTMAVIMYTSGSTGTPKGVMVKHSQLLSMAGAVKQQWPALEEAKEMYLAYLPLAHILEMASEFFCFATGQQIGYSDPKALMCRPGACYPTGGLEEFRPTMMAGVPKVWEGIKAAGTAKLGKASPIAKALVELAFDIKRLSQPYGKSTPLFDLLVFKKFKAVVGGRLKVGISGGGPISPEVQEWVRSALCAPLVQGYGLTESCGGLTIQTFDDYRLNVVGSVLPCCEVLLHSEPEITDKLSKPYLSTDQAHPIVNSDGVVSQYVKVLGRGEVWARGANITAGYYRQPEMTRAEYDNDGWFHTGDIGVMLPDGSLQIVDRKKNLVKLKGGEYIALEQMAVAYNNSPFVNVLNGGTCAYGDGSMDSPVLLAQVSVPQVEATAAELGIKGSIEQLIKNKDILAAAKASFVEVGRRGGLSRLELIAGCALILEPWTPQNGCKTPNDSKLQAKGIYKLNKAELDQLIPVGIR